MHKTTERLFEMNKSIDLSAVIVTYNPNTNKLLTTIKSVLIQRDINLEIIISDDGSKTFPEKEVKDFFERYNFNNV